ncbi:MAG: DUF4364 family protein [Christensenellaceae bacterium]|jgi:hypothetical protein
MKIKPKQTMAQNKLLLLYLIQSANVELSELQIVRIMGELDLMRYFDLKEGLFELEQNGDILPVVYPHTVVYRATPKGEEMLAVLKDGLRASFIERIDGYILEHKKELAMEAQFVAEYIRLAENEYRVMLKVLEDNRALFEVNLLVYSKEEAERMAADWPQKAVDVYKEVALTLG